jgi:hypothetical protein
MTTTTQHPVHHHAKPKAEARDCGCGEKQDTPVRLRECVPCDLDRFCRNNYFTGKLLTARDLSLEQRYMRDKLRLHHRVLHGWGVVCGLRVKPHPYCPHERLVIEPGVAVDACGYEIVVPMEVEIELPKPPSRRLPPATPRYGESERHPQQQEHSGHEHGGNEAPRYGAHTAEPRYGEQTGEPRYGAPQEQHPPSQYPQQQSYGGSATPSQGEPSRDPCDPREMPIPLAICIRYAECEEDFSPAPFDECGCNGPDRKRPNRVCEGFAIDLRFEEPPRVDPCPSGECAELLVAAHDACPSPIRGECLTLAYIEEYRAGETVVAERIDNRGYRRVMLSTRVLEQAVRCLVDRSPRQALTRVQDFNWTHAQEYNAHDFLQWFTGEGQGGPAFSVTFDAPVRSDALSRIFQAAVVRQGGNGPAGRIDIAPSRVWPSADARVLYLQIDRSWVERELRGVRFDVYLTLRCGLVVDQKGRAVDGDLLARVVDDDRYLVAPPTGDGVPGGNMDSWICVRP